FVGPHSLFIDVMMNVGIIFWAAQQTGDQALHQVAVEHCRTTVKYLVRDDGGTAHEGTFDPDSGTFLKQTTHQGHRGDSTWSRGRVWPLYAFTPAYRFTKDEAFLNVARSNAEFWLRRSPPGLVPYWDYNLPADVPHLWDSSAGAIAASGLWDLGEVVSDAGERRRYHAAALTILQTLCTDEFLPRKRPEWEGILMHGVYHYHKNLGVDESVAWGDHFFVEALVKALAGSSEAAWGGGEDRRHVRQPRALPHRGEGPRGPPAPQRQLRPPLRRHRRRRHGLAVSGLHGPLRLRQLRHDAAGQPPAGRVRHRRHAAPAVRRGRAGGGADRLRPRRRRPAAAA